MLYWLVLWRFSRFLHKLCKILTLRLPPVRQSAITSLFLTEVVYSWLALCLKIGFRLVEHTLCKRPKLRRLRVASQVEWIPNFPHMSKSMCNRACQLHRLFLNLRDGAGKTHQMSPNGFNLVQLDTSLIIRDTTLSPHAMLLIKSISTQKCRQTNRGCITIDVSKKIRSNVREQIVPCPPLLDFFCGRKR